MTDHLDTLRSVAPWWRQYVRCSTFKERWVHTQCGYRIGENGLEWCSEQHFPGPYDLIDRNEAMI